MLKNLITQPYSIILDPTGGGGRAKPVANGKFYVGEIDRDPVNNPRTNIFYNDETGTERPLASPLITNNSGVFVASESDGTIIQPYLKDDLGYSVLITDKNNNPLYSNDHVSDKENFDEFLRDHGIKSSYKTINDLINNKENYTLYDGMRVTTGATTWKIYKNSNLNTGIPITGTDFKAEPLNGVWVNDTGCDSSGKLFCHAELQELANILTQHMLGGSMCFSGEYLLGKTLSIKPNLDLEEIEPGSGWHFSQRTPIKFKGSGYTVIKAGADMEALIYLYVDRDSDGSWNQKRSHGAAFSVFEYLQLEDNGFNVSKIIKTWYVPSVSVNKCNIRNKNGTGYYSYGVGINAINHSVIAANTCIYHERSGDNNFSQNDFYPVRNRALNRGIGIDFGPRSGNTNFTSSTFTGEAQDWTGDELDLDNPSEFPICVRLSGDYSADPSIEVRDVTGTDVEFFRCFYGVFAKGLPQRNVYNIVLENPHVVNKVSSLIYAENVNRLKIKTPRINTKVDVMDRVQIYLTGCDFWEISDIEANELDSTLVEINNSSFGTMEGGAIRNCAKSSAGTPLIKLSGSSNSNRIGGDMTVVQTSSSYGQTFVREEGTSNSNIMEEMPILLGINTPYAISGGDTIAVYKQYSTQPPESGHLEKNYNVGDIIVRKPALSGQSEGWVCVTGGWIGSWKEYGSVK